MPSPLRELLAQFGFEFDTRAAAQATQSISGVIGAARSLGQTLLAGAVVQGIASFVNGMIETGSELADASAQMGISATELTEWRYASHLAGVDAGELNMALARTALAAQRNSPIFRQLGISTRDSSGNLRRASDIFEDAGVALGGLSNETQRTAFATQLFGRSGRALIPLFREGRNGVRELRAEVRRLYGTDLDRLAEQADAAGDAQDRLSEVWSALRTRLSLYVLPVLTSVLETLVDWGVSFAEATRGSNILQGALAVLGAIAVGAALATIGIWGPPVVMFGLLAAAVAFVILAVDDLITTFQGGRSVIRTFLDELFGIGTTSEVIDSLRRGWDSWMSSIRETVQELGRLRDAWRELTGQTETTRDSRVGTASGEARSSRRGFDASTALTATQDRERQAERREAERIGSLPAVFGAREGAVVAPRPSSVSVRRDVNVAAIHVSGAGDPVAVGREVRRQIEAASADDIDQTAADLAPATGSA